MFCNFQGQIITKHNQRFLLSLQVPVKLDKKGIYTVTLSPCVFQLEKKGNVYYDPEVIYQLFRIARIVYFYNGLPIIFFIYTLYFFKNPGKFSKHKLIKLSEFYPTKKRDQHVFWTSVILLQFFLKIGKQGLVELDIFHECDKLMYIQKINTKLSNLVEGKIINYSTCIFGDSNAPYKIKEFLIEKRNPYKYIPKF